MVRLMLLTVRRIVICTGGILTLRGRTLEATTWEQITAIQPRVPANQPRTTSGGPTIVYRIKRSNGSPLTLDATRGAQVEEQYVAVCKPTLLAQYESSAPLTLGKLGIDFTGVTLDTRTLPWHEIEAVRVRQKPPRLNIFTRGQNKPWAALQPAEVPCLALVEQVIEQIRTQQKDGE